MARLLIKVSILLLLVTMAIGGSYWLRQHEPKTGYLPVAIKESPMQELTQIALSSSRGILCEVLWFRINRLQQDNQYIDIIPLTDWLTQLDPQATNTWIYHAWNLSYNISSMYTSPKDRWPWVLRGINLLQHSALRYIPQEPKIYRELGWLYEHKISGSSDTASPYYRDSLKALPLTYDPHTLEPLLGSVTWSNPAVYAFYWYNRGEDDQGQLRMVMRLIHQGYRGGIKTFTRLAKCVYLANPSQKLKHSLLEFAHHQQRTFDPWGATLLNTFIQELRAL